MDEERKIVEEHFRELCIQEIQSFPKKGQTLNASLKAGVYIIRNGETILHVGRTYRGKKGLYQRLGNHLVGASSFTQNYLHGNGATLRKNGYTYQYLELENPRKRALLEHYATGKLCPKYLGTGEGK